MKTPKIKWPKKQSKIDEIINDSGYTKNKIEKRIVIAIEEAEKMAKIGDRCISSILNKDKSKWVSSWNNNATLVLWFGKVSKKNHVKDVGRRMEDVCNKVTNKVLTIKIKTANGTYNAMNGGSFLSPNRFQVYPRWIKKEDKERGSIIIHELLHEWFLDQKLDGKKVYGSTAAKKLAKKEPKKARKSAENYEHFCINL